MTIGRVGSYPVSFGNFYANSKGAYNLASELTGNPELEQKFMQNLVEPLSHTKKYSVFIEDNTVGIIDDKGQGIMSVIRPGALFDHSLAVVYDYETHSRNGLRSQSSVIPTNNFEKDGYLLHHIEIAKNIILDREAIAAKQAEETYAKIANETLDQKYDRFTKIFKYKN